MNRASRYGRSHSSDRYQRTSANSTKKYATIKATIDSGENTRTQMERMELMRNLYKMRPDEIFRRINITTLLNLMIEVSKLEFQLAQGEEIEFSDDEDADSAIDNNEGEENEPLEEEMEIFIRKVQEHPGSKSARNDYQYFRLSQMSGMRSSSSVADLVQGIGELDDRFESASVINNESKEHTEQRPYLLMDVRHEEHHLNGHIVTSISYPHSRLSRSINFETKTMLKFKNQAGKIIVLYDYDESIAAKCATTLIERGYDNVFMLSGGLRVAEMKFPQNLITKTKEAFSIEDIIGLEEQVSEIAARNTKPGSRLSRT